MPVSHHIIFCEMTVPEDVQIKGYIKKLIHHGYVQGWGLMLSYKATRNSLAPPTWGHDVAILISGCMSDVTSQF